MTHQILILGDCFKIFDSIPDKSIDLILTDPPYNLKWKQQIELHGRKPFYWNYDELQTWDSVDIKELYNKLMPHFDRILKDTGSILMFARNEWVTYLVDAGKKYNIDVKQSIFWKKTNPPPQTRKKNYLSAVETVIWLARWKEKSVPYTFNFKKRQIEMLNWIEMPLCGGKERTLHPTQKPEKLIEHFIEIHSNKDDWIFDPFAGSGTVPKMARDMGRNSIGVEIEPKYFKWAKERLAGQQQITGNVGYVFIDLNLDSDKEKKLNIIRSLLEENKLRIITRAPAKKRPIIPKQLGLNG
jgi:DNA modification methylase